MDQTRRRAHHAGRQGELIAPGTGRRRRRRAGLRGPRPQGLPVLRLPPTRPTSRPSASGSMPSPRTSTPSGATGCTSTTTRTTPCTPRCDRREHLRRRPRRVDGQRRRGVPRGEVGPDRRPRAAAAHAGDGRRRRRLRPWLNWRPSGRQSWCRCGHIRRAPHEAPRGGAGTGRRHPWTTLVAVGLVYLALGFALWVRAWEEGVTTHTLCGCGDPALFLWFFQWPATALAHGHNPFFSTALSHPKGINLLAQTSVTGLSLPLDPGDLDLGAGRLAQRRLHDHPRAHRVHRAHRHPPLGVLDAGSLRGWPPLRLLALRVEQPGVRTLHDGGSHRCATDPHRARRDRRAPAPHALGAGLLLGVLVFVQFFLSTGLWPSRCCRRRRPRRAGRRRMADRSRRGQPACRSCRRGSGRRHRSRHRPAGLADMVRAGRPGPPLGCWFRRHRSHRRLCSGQLRLAPLHRGPPASSNRSVGTAARSWGPRRTSAGGSSPSSPAVWWPSGGTGTWVLRFCLDVLRTVHARERRGQWGRWPGCSPTSRSCKT